MNERNGLLNALHNSYNYYSQFTNAFQNLHKARYDLQAYTSNRKNQQISASVIVLSAIIYFIIGYMLPLFLSTFFNKDIIKLFFAIGQMIAFVPTILIIVLAISNKKKKYNKTVAEMHEYINGANNFLFNCYLDYMESGFQVVPFVYCESRIIGQLAFYIESCRADTLKEAINCFVSDINMARIQHNQMLSLSVAQQQLIETRKIKAATRVGAAAAVWLNF